VPLSRELIREVRHLDEYDLRRLTIFVRGLLLSRDAEAPDVFGDAEPAGREGRPGKVTYRQERVRCGREGCARCPHGPYWYAYWRESGKVRSRYIGKQLPGDGPGPMTRKD
jgi:hypothetical protein